MASHITNLIEVIATVSIRMSLSNRRQLWEEKSLIFQLSIMNFRIRFKGTYLGFLWAALEPLFVFLILYLVFTTIFPGRENFPIYLLTGIIFYHMFSRATLAGVDTLRINASILKSVNIRRDIFPVVSTTTSLFNFIIEIGVFFAIMPFLGFVPGWTIVFLPLLVILLLGLVLGLTFLLSIIDIYFRDVQRIWGLIIHAMFFVTPIFWFVNEMEGILTGIQKINPVGQIIEMAHQIVVYGEVPQISEWAYVSLFVFGILVFGYFVFRKFESQAIELV